MTRDETRQIMKVIDNVYPNWHPKDPAMITDIWMRLFDGYQFVDVSEALRRYMVSDKNGFAPVPGQLIDIMHSEIDDEDNNELLVWGMVRKAISNGTYHAEEEYAKLPPTVQKAVGPSSNLSEWALMDIETVGSVVQSNFLRTYRAVLKREREERRYSPINSANEIEETKTETKRLVADLKTPEHEFDLNNEFTRQLLDKYGQNPKKESA